MTVLLELPDGKKIVYAEGTADNSAGASATNIDVDLTFKEINNILDTVGIIVTGDAYIVSITKTGKNTMRVTLNVTAGAVATTKLYVLGY